MEINFRIMNMNDVEGVYEVEVSSFSEPWTKHALKDEMKNNLSRYIVAANCENKIVGYIGSWFIIDEAHITNVAVHKDFRGNKIGEKLIESLIELCKESGIISMTLEVRASNIVAQNLYKKYGFLPGGIRKEYYSDNREDAIIMWKQLGEVK